MGSELLIKTVEKLPDVLSCGIPQREESVTYGNYVTSLFFKQYNTILADCIKAIIHIKILFLLSSQNNSGYLFREMGRNDSKKCMRSKPSTDGIVSFENKLQRTGCETFWYSNIFWHTWCNIIGRHRSRYNAILFRFLLHMRHWEWQPDKNQKLNFRGETKDFFCDKILNKKF